MQNCWNNWFKRLFKDLICWYQKLRTTVTSTHFLFNYRVYISRSKRFSQFTKKNPKSSHAVWNFKWLVLIRFWMFSCTVKFFFVKKSLAKVFQFFSHFFSRSILLLILSLIWRLILTYCASYLRSLVPVIMNFSLVRLVDVEVALLL